MKKELILKNKLKEVRAERKQTLGIRWLTKYTRARGEKTMAERLS